MEIWSKCDICGRDIPVGELCYGLKKGNCICKDCCTGFENCTFTLAPAPTLTPPNEPLSVLVNDEPDREYIDYICPKCKSIISQRRRGQRMETVYKCKFHDNCGQRVDWSNPQPYRRPPEGEA